MNWKDKLDAEDCVTVTGYEQERSAAVMAWLDGKISMTEARVIVKRCNKAIQKIAEGAA